MAKFIVSYWGDKVNFGIELAYPPARLHRLAGWCDNPMPESTKSRCQELGIFYSCFLVGRQPRFRGSSFQIGCCYGWSVLIGCFFFLPKAGFYWLP